MPNSLKIIPAAVSWAIFTYVIFNIDYPKSLSYASIFHFFVFFTSLFLSLTFTINIILKSLIFCMIISSGAVVLLILKGLDILNLVTLALTLTTIILLLSYFKKPKRNLRKL